jgi:photosystem II stability/assembly factor-like uncharacterized protein
MSLRPFLIAALLVTPPAFAQSWQPQTSGTTAELRGLSVVSAKVAWASGTKGTVLRTVDGSRWQAMQIPDADKIDLRDIQAFDADTAIAMGAGPGAASRLFRTVDGGAHWTPIVTNGYADGFWDGMAFWDKNNGILFGDPVKGRFQVYTTSDGGASWREVEASGLEALPSEGAFAASGTSIAVAGSQDAWIGTGGAADARVFHSSDRGRIWQAQAAPIPAGAAAKGVFSVAFANPKEGVAVGGDYKEAKLAGINGARTRDGGLTWTAMPVQPQGYLSVVAAVPGAAGSWVAGGLAGSGMSRDGGKTWTAIDATPINTIGFADASTGWTVGPKGLLMKYVEKTVDAGR